MRNNKMIGAIGFAKNNTLLSKLIRWATQSEWSHTFIIVDKPNGDYVILEANLNGVQITSYCPCLSIKVEAFEIKKNKENIQEAIRKTYKLIGKTYGYWQLIGMAWILLLYRFGIKKNNPFRHGVICSELVYEYLSNLNIALAFQKDSITPEDLYNFVILDPVLFPKAVL